MIECYANLGGYAYQVPVSRVRVIQNKPWKQGALIAINLVVVKVINESCLCKVPDNAVLDAWRWLDNAFYHIVTDGIGNVVWLVWDCEISSVQAAERSWSLIDCGLCSFDNVPFCFWTTICCKIKCCHPV
jgi:hypothetical protein